MMKLDRRSFLKCTAGVAAFSCVRLPAWSQPADAEKPFEISLAEWSLNKSLRAGKLTNLEFPAYARNTFGMEAVEFVDQFFADKARDKAYLRELKTRASDAGVDLLLIMIDTNGPLGAAKKEARRAAVEKTYPWIDAAVELGCYAVRVNAYGDGGPDELRARVSESLVDLSNYAAERDIAVCVENHGGLSSDPEWMVSLVKEVDRTNFGTLPDFGNFPGAVDRYRAVEMLLPYAKAVSAKASRFSPDGQIADTDFPRMMRIVRDGGYRGHVGIETGASEAEGEPESIRMTHEVLKEIRRQQRKVQPIFNGKNLDGWVKVEGGEWQIQEGVLVGRNGRNWTTQPEKTGSWLRTERQYADFRLELQFAINDKGNSGVFFRSAAEKNPAFTGYEMQIYGAHGQEPAVWGPGAIYDVVAPRVNSIRPAGEWNTVTLIARGPRIVVEMNGERIVDAELDRSRKGYIGLQNHDERSVVRFKNIRLREL